MKKLKSSTYIAVSAIIANFILVAVFFSVYFEKRPPREDDTLTISPTGRIFSRMYASADTLIVDLDDLPYFFENKISVNIKGSDADSICITGDEVWQKGMVVNPENNKLEVKMDTDLLHTQMATGKYNGERWRVKYIVDTDFLNKGFTILVPRNSLTYIKSGNNITICDLGTQQIEIK